MELERRDIPPASILPAKAKRRRKKENVKGNTVIIQIDLLSPPVVRERRVDDAPVAARTAAGQQITDGGARVKNVVLIGVVAMVVLVLGAAILKPDAVKIAAEFFGAIGRLSTTFVTTS